MGAAPLIPILVLIGVTTPFPRVDSTRGQVELSLRLSHIDPAAAKRERRRADRERGREGGGGAKAMASSDGESAEADRYWLNTSVHVHLLVACPLFGAVLKTRVMKKRKKRRWW